MSFKDIRFPTDPTFGIQGGPGFLTNVVFTNSGKEFREDVWELERGEWDISHEVKVGAKFRPLPAFFRVVKGRAYSFRFKDWSDFEAASGEGLFIDTDDSPPAKQMIKRYTFDGETFDRVITKPVNGKITTDAVSLDYATGIAASGTSWSGEFDCHVRFDTDKMQSTVINRSGGEIVVSWSGIKIIEIKG